MNQVAPLNADAELQLRFVDANSHQQLFYAPYALCDAGIPPYVCEGLVARPAAREPVQGKFAFVDEKDYRELVEAARKSADDGSIAVIIAVRTKESYRERAAKDVWPARLRCPVLYVSRQKGDDLLTGVRSSKRPVIAMLGLKQEKLKQGSVGFIGRATSAVQNIWQSGVQYLGGRASLADKLADVLRSGSELQLDRALGIISEWQVEERGLPMMKVQSALRDLCAARARSPDSMLLAGKLWQLAQQLRSGAVDQKHRAGYERAADEFLRAFEACLGSCDFAELMLLQTWPSQPELMSDPPWLPLRTHALGTFDFELTVTAADIYYSLDGHLQDWLSLPASRLRARDGKTRAVLLTTAMWMRTVCSGAAHGARLQGAPLPFDVDAVQAWARAMRESAAALLSAEAASVFLEAAARHAPPATLHLLAAELPQSLECFCRTTRVFLFPAGAPAGGADDPSAARATRDLVLELVRRAHRAGQLDEQAIVQSLAAVGGGLPRPAMSAQELARDVVELTRNGRLPPAEHLAAVTHILDAIGALDDGKDGRSELILALLLACTEAPRMSLPTVALMHDLVLQVARTSSGSRSPHAAGRWLERIARDARAPNGHGAVALATGAIREWVELTAAVLAAKRGRHIVLSCDGCCELMRALLCAAVDQAIQSARAKKGGVRAAFARGLIGQLLAATAEFHVPPLAGLAASPAEAHAANASVAELARALVERADTLASEWSLLDPSALRSLAGLQRRGDGASALHCALVDEVIRSIVDRHGEPSDDILAFGSQLFGTAAGVSPGAREFACRLLERHCLQRWWPVDFESTLSLRARTLEQLSALADPGASLALVARWRQLAEMAEAWAAEWHAKRLSLDDIERVVSRQHSYPELIRCCARGGDGLARPLPTLRELVSSVDEIRRVHGELEALCYLEPMLAVSTFFDAHAAALPSALSIAVHGLRPEALWQRASWAGLVVDRDDLRAWRASHEEQLSMLAHFAPSSLFRDQLRALRAEAAEEMPESSKWDSDAFLEAADTALSALERLVDPGRTSFQDVRFCASTLAAECVEPELNLLVAWPALAHLSDGVALCAQNVRGALALLKLSAPLAALVNCLEQYHFDCAAGSDADFAFLQELSDQLGDELVMASRPMAACLDDLSRTVQLLGGSRAATADVGSPSADCDIELSRILRRLELFSALSSATHVWELVRDKGWFDPEGLKVRFRAEYENVTNLLQGEDYETTVLNQLDAAVHFVAAAMQARGLRLSELLPSIFTGASRALLSDADNHFAELGEVQRNISRIKAWFTRGLGDIEGTFDEMGTLLEHGIYEFALSGADGTSGDLGSVTLSLTFDDDGRDTLTGTQLDDFARRLCFVQRDEKAAGLRIAEVLAEFNHYSKALEAMRELVALGHPLLDGGPLYRRVLGETADEAAQWAAQLRCSAVTWLDELEGVREDHELLLLISTCEARSLHAHLAAAAAEAHEAIEQAAQGLGRGVEARSLGDVAAHMLSRLFQCLPPAVAMTRQRICEFASSCFFAALPFDASRAWPKTVGSFLSALHHALDSPELPLRFSASRESAVVVGLNVHMLDGAMPELLLRLLMHIFGRVPESFEVLVCSRRTRLSELNLFLQRASRLSRRAFAIVHVDALPSAGQDALLSFLLDRRRDGQQIRPHCIVDGPSLLQPAPWIHTTQWGANSQKSSTLLPHSRVAALYKAGVVDQSCIRSVRVFTSLAPGAGKTHAARKEIARLGCDSLTICLSEAFDAAAVGRLLMQHEERQRAAGAAVSAIFFQIQVGFFETLDELALVLQPIAAFLYEVLVLRLVGGSEDGLPYPVPADAGWHVLVEVPSLIGHAADAAHVDQADWYATRALPLLWLVGHGDIVEPPDEFEIGDEARRVAKYLRAYNDGTINRKFGDGAPVAKHIVMVLDVSGSMKGAKLAAAVDSMLGIIDSHFRHGDKLSLITFDDHVVVRLNAVSDVTDDVRKTASDTRNIQGGGTDMYSAVCEAIALAQRTEISGEHWLFCLTDGVSSTNSKFEATASLLQAERLHVVVIGVALQQSLVPEMAALSRPRADSKGRYIPCGESAAALADAFAEAASLLPVSQTFDLDGSLTDGDCREWLDRYMPKHVAAQRGNLLRQFWVSYLHRRVRSLDDSPEFNFNRELEGLGSTLMEVMLLEVDSALREGQERSWRTEAHRQLIYDFSQPDGPKFGILCTSPELIDPQSREQLSSLGFSLPSSTELATRECLDEYLARALSLTLDERGLLGCIDDFGFVLTLDFAVKLLHIHERVACRTPCVMEGETGVSKTALTRMYALLLNTSARERARATVHAKLERIAHECASSAGWIAAVEREGARPEGCGALEPLVRRISAALDGASEVAELAARSLLQLCDGIAPPLASAPPELLAAARAEHDVLKAARAASETSATASGPMTAAHALLEWVGQAAVLDCFFPLNVHSALTPADITSRLQPAIETARALKAAELQGAVSRSPVVVFLDEVNTASCMGVFKALVLDRTLNGEAIPENMVVIAACNPARSLSVASAGVLRQDDLGKDWALGHYQVSALPGSLAAIKWKYGALGSEQEGDFIACRLEQELAEEARAEGGGEQVGSGSGSASADAAMSSMAKLICTSMELMRTFSEEHLRARIASACPGLSAAEVAAQAAERAKTAVSLRDIQRLFVLRRFFARECGAALFARQGDTERRALLLAVACVFYVRLDRPFRARLLAELRQLPSEQLEPLSLDVALAQAMTDFLEHAHLPRGIARTEGLTENCFMVFVCTLARVPLMIVGPPGSSKTLSMGIIEANARGEESSGHFFRPFESVTVFSYQCSRRSTSSDIESVFQRATERQSSNRGRSRCVVFMDEAGLPEEKRESLKVLHYLIEGANPAEATPTVSFVAITNHVLDAAKSNRCACLLRGEPDEADLQSISRGCLMDGGELAAADAASSSTGLGANDLSAAGSSLGSGLTLSHRVAGLPDECGEVSLGELIERLCRAYTDLVRNKAGDCKWFEHAFGLRDFIHFLRLLRRRSEATPAGFRTSPAALLGALARNFGGVEPTRFSAVVSSFISRLFGARVAAAWVPARFPDTVDVLGEAINDRATGEDAPRYILLLDESADDSALRLPRWHGIVTPSSAAAGLAGTGGASVVLKLSDFSDDFERRQVSLISAVKLAAAQGAYVELSGSEPVHESLYALFNQQLKQIRSKDGTVRQYANVAVGSYSKPCLVHASFRCAVHLPLSQLPEAPAAFLNRFEKHCLRAVDILRTRLALLPAGLAAALLDARRTALAFAEDLAGSAWLRSLVELQTVDSVMLGMLPRLDAPSVEAPTPAEQLQRRDVLAGSAAGALGLCAAALDAAREYLVLRSSPAAEELAEDGRASAASRDPELAAAWDRLSAEPIANWADHVRSAIAADRAEGEASGADLDGGGGDDSTVSIAMRVAGAALRHVLEREACERLLLLAPPETLLPVRARLPRSLMRAYFEQQEHFSLVRLIEQARAKGGLHVVHTRTTPAVHRLLDRGAGEPYDAASAERDIGLPSDVAVARLATFSSEEAFRDVVLTWAAAPSSPCLLLVADLSTVSLERVTFARVAVEEVAAAWPESCAARDDAAAEHVMASDITAGGGRAPGRTLLLLLHSPPSRVTARTLHYPALFHADWSHCALDGVGAAAPLGAAERAAAAETAAAAGADCGLLAPSAVSDARDAREWCALACGVRAEWDVTPCLRACSPTAMRVAASRVRMLAAPASAAKGAGVVDSELSLRDRQELVSSFMRQAVGTAGFERDSSVRELVCRRFAQAWDGPAIDAEVSSAAERLASGRLNVALGEEVGGVLEATFCSFAAWLVHQLAADGSLSAHEQQRGTAEGDTAVELFAEILELIRVPPLAELRLLVNAYPLPPHYTAASSAPPAAGALHIPLFSSLLRAVDAVVDDAVAALAQRAESSSALSAREAWPLPAAVDAEVRRSLALHGGDSDSARRLVRWLSKRVASSELLWRAYARQLIAHSAVLEPMPHGSLCTVLDVLALWLEKRVPASVQRSVAALHAAERAARTEMIALASLLAPVAGLGSHLSDAWAHCDAASAEARAVDATVRGLQASLESIVVGCGDSAARTTIAPQLRAWAANCTRLLRDLPAFLPPPPAAAGQRAGAALTRAAGPGAAPGGVGSIAGQLDVLATLSQVCAHGDSLRAAEAHARLMANGARTHSLEAALREVCGLGASAAETRAATSSLLFWFTSPWRLAHAPPRRDADLTCALRHAGSSLCELSAGQRVALASRVLLPAIESDGEWLPLKLSLHAVRSADELLAAHRSAAAAVLERGHFLPAYLLPQTAQPRSSTEKSADEPWLLADALFASLLKQLLVRYGSQPVDGLVPLLEASVLRSSSGSSVFELIYAAAARVFFLSRLAHEAAMRAGAGAASQHGGAEQQRVHARQWLAARKCASSLLAGKPELQRFTFALLLRSFGQAAIEAVLTDRDAFGADAWADEWRRHVVPSDAEAADERARRARMAELTARMAELHADEEHKARTLRCCPVCGRATERIEGCLAMICGRDYHSRAGIDPSAGCGAQYDWGTALPYVKDVAALAAKRDETAARYELAATAEAFWDDLAALTARLPEAFAAVVSSGGLGDALPTTALVTEAASDPEFAAVSAYLGARHQLHRLRALPDLVRLYLWLDEHLANLVTRETAAKLTMADVFGAAQLRARFGASEGQGARALWERARDGYNAYLAADGQHLARGACGAANELAPLSDETLLLHLLSDAQDASDGNDALLVVIARMVERYCELVEAIAVDSSSASPARQPDIHPAAVSSRNMLLGDLLPHELCDPGGAGAAAGGRDEEAAFERSVERFWLPHTARFDLEAVRAHIGGMIASRCRKVGNPEMQLRRRFRFRADAVAGGEGASVGAEEASALVAAVESACALGARAAGCTLPSGEALQRKADEQWSVLHAVLHAAPYSQLRALLHGAKMAADLYAEVAGTRQRALLARASRGAAFAAAAASGGGAEEEQAAAAAAAASGGGAEQEQPGGSGQVLRVRAVLECAATGAARAPGGGKQAPAGAGRAARPGPLGERPASELLHMLELPGLDGEAAELLLGLTVPLGLSALARFLGGQLVRQAHEFAHLPLGMKRPLPGAARSHLRAQEFRASRTRDVCDAAGEIEAALAHAERDTASADWAAPLSSYLAEVCGLDSDGEAIGVLLPANLRLHHSVALRVQLRALVRAAVQPGAEAGAGEGMAEPGTWAWAPARADAIGARDEHGGSADGARLGASAAMLANRARRALWFELGVEPALGSAEPEAAKLVARVWRGRVGRKRAAAARCARADEAERVVAAARSVAARAEAERAVQRDEAPSLAAAKVAAALDADVAPSLAALQRTRAPADAPDPAAAAPAVQSGPRRSAPPHSGPLRGPESGASLATTRSVLALLALAPVCGLALKVRSGRATVLSLAAAATAAALACAARAAWPEQRAARRAAGGSVPPEIAAWVKEHGLPAELARFLAGGDVGAREVSDILWMAEADLDALNLSLIDRRKWNAALAELEASRSARAPSAHDDDID